MVHVHPIIKGVSYDSMADGGCTPDPQATGHPIWRQLFLGNFVQPTARDIPVFCIVLATWFKLSRYVRVLQSRGVGGVGDRGFDGALLDTRLALWFHDDIVTAVPSDLGFDDSSTGTR